jgi:y4mF family transcriptional regulator
VRERRRALGLTQQDLAELAGVSERFIRFVEQAKASVQLDALESVLDALGLELRVGARGGP